MRKFQWFGLILILAITTQTNAQNSFSFSCSKDTTIDGCASSCITLKAKIPDIRSSTSDYVVNSLTSAGGCFRTYVSPDAPGTPVGLSQDDYYSALINLPFAFPFYGDAASPYNSVVLSTNGYLSFDATRALQSSHYGILNGGGFLSASTGNGQDLPSTLYDKSVIMGPYHDIDPALTTSPTQRIKYDVLGVAPHRRFVFSFYKIPLFNCTTLIQNTQQIVLYEGLGIIEVFIYKKENCSTWNKGRAMVGLQNDLGDKGIMAPGRKASDLPWGAGANTDMNESWRFIPASGPSLLRSVELYDLSGNLISTGDTSGIGNGTLEVSFPSVCPVGTTTYIVKSRYAQFNDPNSFIYGTDTVQVISNNPLSATTATTSATCASAGLGTVAVFATGAPGTFEFSADNGATWQGNIFSLPPGTYTIKFRIVGTTCVGTTTAVVNADANLVSGTYAVSNVLCNGGSTGSINATGLNGSGVFQYSIDGGTTYQNSGNFSNLPAGTYTVRIKDNTNCLRDTTINITEPTVLFASASTSNATCSTNGNIVLEAVGGADSYEFSLDGTTYQPLPNFSVIDGNYIASVKDLNGCIDTLHLTVGLTNDLFVNTRVDTTICLGASIQLTTNSFPGATFSWTGSDLDNSTIQSPTATPTSIGVHPYAVLATLGRCTANDNVNINVNSQVQVNAGANQNILSGETVQLNGVVTGANNYLWSSSPVDATLTSTTILNPIVTPASTTTYTLTATNDAGCNASADITITVIPYCIRVKNAFSPNGDGINDKWKIYDQYDCLSNITLTAFNRYGSKVFESKNYRNDWDGTYNGKPVPDGTYYAVIEFYLVSNKKVTTKTDLTIIR
jgi:hypothetical protein